MVQGKALEVVHRDAMHLERTCVSGSKVELLGCDYVVGEEIIF